MLSYKILVSFRSNDDDLKKETWPEYVFFQPKEEDVVQAKSGRIAKICRITHRYDASPSIELKPIYPKVEPR